MVASGTRLQFRLLRIGGPSKRPFSTATANFILRAGFVGTLWAVRIIYVQQLLVYKIATNTPKTEESTNVTSTPSAESYFHKGGEKECMASRLAFLTFGANNGRVVMVRLLQMPPRAGLVAQTASARRASPLGLSPARVAHGLASTGPLETETHADRQRGYRADLHSTRIQQMN